MTVTILLAMTPPSKNEWERMHWARRHKIKRQWTSMVALELLAAEVPRCTAETISLSAVVRFQRRAARRDPQNYAQTLWHLIPDALVQGGWLVDDDDGRITWPENLGMTLDVGPWPSTEIRIDLGC